MHRVFHPSWIVAVAMVALAAPESLARNSGEHAVVVNGNTLIIGTKRVYLRGVDAPEMDQLCLVKNIQWACGKQAARELTNKIGGRPINCKVRGVDTVDCWANGVNLGSWMVSNGWAAASSRRSIYTREEQKAKKAKRGIWRSEFVHPWSWRRGLRADTAATNSEARTCAIKGDITVTGDRIYFMPKHPKYGDVQIDITNNERWFCTKEQAKRAGWNAPGR